MIKFTEDFGPLVRNVESGDHLFGPIEITMDDEDCVTLTQDLADEEVSKQYFEEYGEPSWESLHIHPDKLDDLIFALSKIRDTYEWNRGASGIKGPKKDYRVHVEIIYKDN